MTHNPSPAHRSAVGYVRLNPDAHSPSLDAQRASITDYCREHQLNLITIYAEENPSAPALCASLEQALAAVAEYQAILVVDHLARLAQSVFDCLYIIHKLDAAAADLVAVAQGIDTTRPSHPRLLFQLFSTLNDMQRSRMLPSLPFGYTLDESLQHIIPHDAERHILRLMIASRFQENKDYDTIAADLNARNQTTRNHQPWDARTVRQILDAQLTARWDLLLDETND
jgi:hypothetical protein